MADKKPIGKVTHFFDKVSVAVVELDAKLKVGDKVKIGKEGTFIEQEVSSMQVDHKSIKAAGAGKEVGMKVEGTVKRGDLVYKL